MMKQYGEKCFLMKYKTLDFSHQLLFFFLFVFIFDCPGSLLLCTGFLQLWHAGATLYLRCARSSLHWLSCGKAPGAPASVVTTWGLMTEQSPLAGSRAQAQRVVVHGLSYTTACGIPQSGIEPVSPELGGEFLSTVPQDSPLSNCLL